MPFRDGLSQFIVTIPPDLDLFRSIECEIAPLAQVIRATSPFDQRSIWIEIFPKGVSKGNAVRQLCDILGIAYRHVATVGNDYNDLSMLEAFSRSFVVENAPRDLRLQFPTIPSNDADGVSTLIASLLPPYIGSTSSTNCTVR